MKNFKTYFLDTSFTDALNYYIEQNCTFTLHLSKYTSTIIWNKNRRDKYKMKDMTKRTFIGYAKILKDLKRPELESTIENIKRTTLEENNSYYSINLNYYINRQDVYGVDLNSAYLACLLTNGLITQETFTWINKRLTKLERLAAVGMLAKRKEIYYYENGQEVKATADESEWRFIFNFIIQEVNNLLKEGMKLTKTAFMYWVDGIYLTNRDEARDLMHFFTGRGYPAKYEFYTEVTNRNLLTYMEYKMKKENGEVKTMNVPITEAGKSLRKAVYDTIKLNKQQKALEKMIQSVKAKEWEQAPDVNKFRTGELF